VLRGGDVLVEAKTVYVVVGFDGSGKRPVPDDLRKALTASG
jgi:acyl-CoA thioesterase FadM